VAILEFTSHDPAEVLAIFNDLAGDTTPERRSSVRTDFHAALLATPLTHPYARGVRILARDISPQGLGGMTHIPLVAGEMYAIPVALSASSHKLLRCRVIFSRTLRGGMHEVGLPFEEVLNGPVGLTSIPAHWIELAT
jgi:hypothetical protein